MGNIYLVNAETSVPMFMQVVQTLGAGITTSVFAYNAGPTDSTTVDMNTIEELFKLSQESIMVQTLEDGDTVIFELPVFAISQMVATGISIYINNIGAAVNTSGAVIQVLFYTNILAQ